MYAAGSLQGIKIVIFVAVFHGVHSDYTLLWIFTEEQHGLGGGVAEAAGVRVRHLGQGELGPLSGRGKISTMTINSLCRDSGGKGKPKTDLRVFMVLGSVQGAFTRSAFIQSAFI
jgi:hypothetical protein